MLNWFSNFQLEKISFFLGFISATILWVVIAKLRNWLPDIKHLFFQFIKNQRIQQSSGLQNAIINEAFLRAQSNHIAKSLFPIDDIIIEPMLLSEPLVHMEEDKVIFESEISKIVPYTPDFPHITRNLNIPRLSMIDACQKSADLIICGMPGSGKTVALAHLVTSIARKSKNCGVLSNKIPFYINVHDTDVLLQPELTLLDMLYKAIAPKLSPSIIPRLSKYIKDNLADNNAILILDALDELPPSEFDQFVGFIKKVKNNYPELQIIVTSTLHYFGELLNLNFSPLFLSAWSNQQITKFYSNWNRLWQKEISGNTNSDFEFLDNTLILNWAAENLKPLTPLEYTLHIWGALSGDLFGSSITDLFHTYTKRILSNKEVFNLAISLAYDSINNSSNYINPSQKDDNFSKLSQSELIRNHNNSKATFIHSEITGYLAGQSSKIEPISEIDELKIKWPAYFTYLGYRSAKEQDPIWINSLTRDEFGQYPSTFFDIIPWLKLTTKNVNWRTSHIRNLVKIIQDEKINFPTRFRAIGGLVLSNDASLNVFFKQLLVQKINILKELALYGISSSAPDKSIIPDLITLSQNSAPQLQKIVCLALSTFESEDAIHELGRVLLGGEENVRKLVAECMAFYPSYGMEILQEAYEMEDIVVRRASINGLVKLNNEWSIQTLKQLMIQDSQWVVRNAASQGLEFLESGNPCIPEKKISLAESPWIIEFAGQNNLGISQVHSQVPILSLALDSQNRRELIQAIRFSIQESSQELFNKMNKLISSLKDPIIINQILLSLYLIKNSKISKN